MAKEYYVLTFLNNEKVARIEDEEVFSMVIEVDELDDPFIGLIRKYIAYLRHRYACIFYDCFCDIHTVIMNRFFASDNNFIEWVDLVNCEPIIFREHCNKVRQIDLMQISNALTQAHDNFETEFRLNKKEMRQL